MAVKNPSTRLFPATFAEGRTRFREAAQVAGARISSHANSAKGPSGEALSTETAWLGPTDASRLLLAMAGTHGAEGFCGSGIQTGWLQTGVLTRLPPDTAVLLVHAINPYGFAWVRRVNENNIDLNRNFIDHGKPAPDSPRYRVLRDAICPSAWSSESEREVGQRFAAYAAEHGAMGLQEAIMHGQYFDAEGVCFGGKGDSWSNRTLRAILEPACGTRPKIRLHRSPYRARTVRLWRDHLQPSRRRRRKRARQAVVRHGGNLERRRQLDLLGNHRRHPYRRAAIAAARGRHRDHAGIRHRAGRRHDERDPRRQLAACARRPREFTRPRDQGARSAPPSIRTRTTGRTWCSTARSTYSTGPWLASRARDALVFSERSQAIRPGRKSAHLGNVPKVHRLTR